VVRHYRAAAGIHDLRADGGVVGQRHVDGIVADDRGVGQIDAEIHEPQPALAAPLLDQDAGALARTGLGAGAMVGHVGEHHVETARVLDVAGERRHREQRRGELGDAAGLRRRRVDVAPVVGVQRRDQAQGV
jgi:hypothetical protein